MYFNQSSNILVNDIQEYARNLLFLSSNSTSHQFMASNNTQTNKYSDINQNNSLVINYSFNNPIIQKQPKFRPITKMNQQITESSSSRSFEPSKMKNRFISLNERTLSKKTLPLRSKAVDLTEHIENARKLKQITNKVLYCTFCKNNGEKEEVYCSHLLKDSTGKITCPVLKTHVCPICHETGEKAHTLTYCKDYKMSKKVEFLQIALDNILKE